MAGVDSLHTMNLFLTRDIGHDATQATGFDFAWQSRLLLTPHIDPAMEAYGFVDDIAHSGHFAEQQWFVGPVAVGGWNFAPYGALKYEAGYLFGLTSATPRGAVRWKFEYEIAF